MLLKITIQSFKMNMLKINGYTGMDPIRKTIDNSIDIFLILRTIWVDSNGDQNVSETCTGPGGVRNSAKIPSSSLYGLDLCHFISTVSCALDRGLNLDTGKFGSEILQSESDRLADLIRRDGENICIGIDKGHREMVANVEKLKSKNSRVAHQFLCMEKTTYGSYLVGSELALGLEGGRSLSIEGLRGTDHERRMTLWIVRVGIIRVRGTCWLGLHLDM
jgi:hypothetical protein